MINRFLKCLVFLSILAVLCAAELSGFAAEDGNLTIKCDAQINLYHVTGDFGEVALNSMVSFVVVKEPDASEVIYADTIHTNKWGEFELEFFMPDSAESGTYYLKCGAYGHNAPILKSFEYTKKDKFNGIKIYDYSYKQIHDREKAGFGVYIYNPHSNGEYRIRYSFDNWENYEQILVPVTRGTIEIKKIDLSYIINGIHNIKFKVMDETGAEVSITNGLTPAVGSSDGLSKKELSQRMTVIDYYHSKPMEEVSRIGMGLYLYDNVFAANTETLDFLKLTGVKNVRIGQGVGLVWEYIEKEKGNYDFSNVMARYIDRMKKDGLNIMSVVGGNKLYGTNSNIPKTSEQLKGHNEYIKALISNIDNIDTIEVWNEPDLASFYGGTTDELVKLTKNAGLASKEAERKVDIVSGVVSSGGKTYNDKLFDGGIYSYVDAYSFHPYVWESNGNQLNIDINDRYKIWLEEEHLLAEKGEGGWLNRYISEIGWSNYTGSSITAEDQAQNLVKVFVYNDWYDIDKTYWFCFIGPGAADPDASRDNMYSLIDSYNKPKLGYVALSQIVNELSNSLYIGRQNMNADAESHIYFADGKLKMVAWSKTGKDIQLNFDNPVEVYDMYGNMTACDVNSVVVNSSPVYILNISQENAIAAVKNDIDVKKNSASYSDRTYWTQIASALTQTPDVNNVISVIDKVYETGESVMNSYKTLASKAELMWNLHRTAKRLSGLYAAFENSDTVVFEKTDSDEALKKIYADRNEKTAGIYGKSLKHTDKVIKQIEDLNKLSEEMLNDGCVAEAKIYDMLAVKLCDWAELIMKKENAVELRFESPEMEAGLKGFTTEDGQRLLSVPKEGNVKANFLIENNTGAKSECSLVVASYEEGALCGIEIETVSAEKGKSEKSVLYDKTKGDEIKTFVFNDMNKLVPISAVGHLFND